MPNLKILRLPDVKELTGLSRSTIYQRMKDGSFPHSIALGPRTVGWLQQEIQDWLELRIQNIERVL